MRGLLLDDARPLDAGMPNDDAFVLGCVARAAGHPGRSDVGDAIDRGLILARLLREYGYGVVRLPEGRTATAPATSIEVPIMDTWLGAMAYSVTKDEDGKAALIGQGWAPPKEEA